MHQDDPKVTRTDHLDDGPVCITSEKGMVEGVVESTAVRDLILAHLA